VITNVQPPSAEEIVYETMEDNDEGCKQVIFRQDQKPVSLMMDLIKKFTKKQGLVVDPFGGTYPVFKACLKLSHHRRFVE